MKILVTGGAGFIGSAVIRRLIERHEHHVVNVDKLTYAGNPISLNTVAQSDRYCFERVDICDRDALSIVFRDHQPDAVMHLAAESHVDRSISQPSDFIQTNLVGTYNLLEVSRAFVRETKNPDNFRFLHISTDEVYGDLSGDDALFTEQTPYAPSSPYSASKAGSDHLVRAWGRTFGLPTIITNCSNNYGPYQFPEKLIPHMILNALDGKALPIYGDGKQVRDWLYVDDHADALLVVLANGQIGETYNIGGWNEKQNIDVVKRICKILDRKRPRKSPNDKYEDLISFVEDRPGHDVRYAIDASKIAKELGWKPNESFDSGIEKTIDWYLENESWTTQVRDGTYREWVKHHYGVTD